MQAMILAAGFGTRLLPYTKCRPKPLFPLLNDPLLLLTVRHLQAAGFDHIIVNCHYLREQIVSALANISGVIVQEEEIVLGTGGGLRMALPNLRDEPLLVTNGDIYHMVNYGELYEAHISRQTAVTMAMHEYPRFNKVTVLDACVTGFDDQDGAHCLAFTGLHVLQPEVLEQIAVGQESSIIDCYRDLLQEDKQIAALRVDGCSWTDMGTMEDYLALHGSLLKKEIPLWPEFTHFPQGPFFVEESVKSRSLSYEEWACIGRAQLADGVTLRRCVVWDDAQIEVGADISDTLLIP